MILSQLIRCAGTTTKTIIQYNAIIIIIHPYQIYFSYSICWLCCSLTFVEKNNKCSPNTSHPTQPSQPKPANNNGERLQLSAADIMCAITTAIIAWGVHRNRNN